MVFDDARGAVQVTGLQLHGHEHALRHFVFAAYGKAFGGQETKARVVTAQTLPSSQYKKRLDRVVIME
jgi:hypothetical protein